MRFSGAKIKRKVVNPALRDMVARATRAPVRKLFGIGGVDAGYGPKAPGTLLTEAGRYFAEQPRTSSAIVAKAAGACTAEFADAQPADAKPPSSPKAQSAKRKALMFPVDLSVGID